MNRASHFAHLHLHTQYSILDGAIPIAKLVNRAAEIGMPAVAMTDHGNMFGAVEFHQADPNWYPAGSVPGEGVPIAGDTEGAEVPSYSSPFLGEFVRDDIDVLFGSIRGTEHPGAVDAIQALHRGAAVRDNRRRERGRRDGVVAS